MNQIGQWILNKIIISALNWAANYLPTLILDWKKKKEREIAQAEAKKQYDKAAANPDLTPEQKAEEYVRYLNSGR